ncbi:MAG: hypothetical protein KKC84_06885 [Candidatus Omnitrophica bacterium]|nr:hypothetical protein [Candidatus Omnitrophota bacterium]
MITVLIVDNEEKIKELLDKMLQEKGNFNMDITKQENILKVIKKVGREPTVTLRDKLIELEDAFYEEKKGVLYKSLLEVIEKPLIEHVLQRTEGNQLKAARILGLNRNTVRAKVKKLGISPTRYKQ